MSNQNPFYQRTFAQDHPYVMGLARMLGAAQGGQGFITGGALSALSGYAQDQEAARQRAIQLYQMQERAKMAQAAGLPVNGYTTLTPEELKTFYDLQANTNAGQTYQNIYAGQAPQFSGPVNPQAVMPLVQDFQKEQFKQYQNQLNAQNLPYAINAIQGQPIPQGAAFPENMATSILQNYTTRQNTQDRLKQQQPLVDARVQYTQSGTQLNKARTQKTQVDTQLAPVKAARSGSGGRGRPKATYDPATVQGILNKIQDPAQRAYWTEHYRRKGSLPVSVVNPKGGSGSRSDKINQIKKDGGSGGAKPNSNEARRKSLGIDY